MIKALVLAAGLFVTPAQAAPPVEAPSHNAPFGKPTPVETIKEKLDEEKSEKEKRREERLKRLRDAQSEKAARIIVLQDAKNDVDFRNETLRRNVRTRIARPTGKFYPDIDLYQSGRKEPEPSLRPLDQRARVPDDVIITVLTAADRTNAIPWSAISESDWGEKMYELKDLADQIWFVDRPELREPLFLLYSAIGYAAENSNNPTPPFYEQVAGNTVNYYWYLAAAMATRDPSLMAKVTDTDRYANINAIKMDLESGRYAPMTLSFDIAGEFDVERFTSDYTVYFNGVEDQITNQKGLYNVPPGIMDVYLQRDDGHSMSVRLEAVKLDDQEIYPVVEQARKRMGIDFIDQLMNNPEQCIPDVDGDILNYLAIYQKLHPGAEIYIAVPEAGSVHKIFLWKWDERKGNLIRINDNTGGFPVRFVALIGTGLTYSGFNFGDPNQVFAPPEPGNETQPVDQLQSVAGDLVRPRAGSLPIAYELRGHWGRLMVGVGATYSLNLGDGQWREVPQTRTKGQTVYDRNAETGEVTIANGSQRIITYEGEDGTIPYMIERTWQRGVFLSVAGVLGKDAAYGFGPRFGGRTGWYNTPHAVDTSLEAGWSFKATAKKRPNPDSRVWPLFDIAGFGGVAWPFKDSIHLMSNRVLTTDNTQGTAGGGYNYVEGPNGSTIWAPMERGGESACIDGCINQRKIGKPIPAFGFTFKVGMTF